MAKAETQRRCASAADPCCYGMASARQRIKRRLPRRRAGKFQADGEQLVRGARLNHETERVVVHAQEARSGGIRALCVHQAQHIGAKIHPRRRVRRCNSQVSCRAD